MLEYISASEAVQNDVYLEIDAESLQEKTHIWRGKVHVRNDIQPFLDGFCYRYNRKSSPDELFSRLLHDAVAI